MDNQFYYFLGTNIDTDLSFDEIYNEGFNDGTDHSNDLAYESGYDKGYDDAIKDNPLYDMIEEKYELGINEGYDLGFIAGKKANYNWWNAVEDFFKNLFETIKNAFKVFGE